MRISEFSGKASVLVSILLIALLLLQFQQHQHVVERPNKVKKTEHSKPALTSRGADKSMKVDAKVTTVVLPLPPILSTTSAESKTTMKSLKQKNTPAKPNRKLIRPSQKQIKSVNYPLKPLRKPQKIIKKDPAKGDAVRLSITSKTAGVKEGRTLLRLLEHGSGPVIEIAWPESVHERASLYRMLSSCYGMRSAIMDSDGRLYVANGARGRKWQPNMDHFSGFVRQPSGHMPLEEIREVKNVRRYHSLHSTATAVRLFPRRVDAFLLGGLRKALGEHYRTAKIIHTTYGQDATRLFLTDIEADGRATKGKITFPISLAGCG